MKHIDYLKDETIDTHTIKKRGKYVSYSDTLYTFDIEVTSLFKISDKYVPFNYDISLNEYRKIDKVALPYIFMFGVEDIVYYSRNFNDIYKVLQKISDKKLKKIIYVHNLSYEIQFLINIFKRYHLTLSDVILRGSRKCITFTITELNIEFRCSYALTNLSLAKCGEHYKCEHQKLTGNLDFNVARSPLTRMNKEELDYCKYDIVVMYEFLSRFRDKYEHVCNIPFTQTGEMRYEMKKHIDYYYIKKRHDRVPDADMMYMLMLAMMGGITHANFIHVDKVLRDVASWDYSSDYPFQMCTQQFPKSRFFEVSYKNAIKLKDKCCFIYVIDMYNAKSKYLNHYISASKCKNLIGARYDNGRLCSFEKASMCVTDVDMDMILQSYNIERVDYIKIYASYKGYLEKEVIEFILDLYENKTTLRGVKEQEEIYMKSKQIINSTFGAAVTNIIKQRYNLDIYSNIMYSKRDITENFINEKLNEMKSSFSTLFDFSTGVWVTAYARKALWDLVMKTDRDCVYYDTDSVKLVNYEKYGHLIDERNKEIYESCKNVSEYYEISFERFEPCDIKGEKHLLGKLEFEGVYKEFKTLGAKKYCYRDDKDVLHLTVAGVNKKAVKKLKSIDDFFDGQIFDYDCGKQAIIYNDNQEPFTFTDIDGNEYTCDDITYSVVIMPTEYRLGVKADFREVLNNLDEDIYY